MAASSDTPTTAPKLPDPPAVMVWFGLSPSAPVEFATFGPFTSGHVIPVNHPSLGNTFTVQAARPGGTLVTVAVLMLDTCTWELHPDVQPGQLEGVRWRAVSFRPAPLRKPTEERFRR